MEVFCVWGVIFDLWTMCGVLCGVICECGLILCGVLCVCGVIVWCVCCVGSRVWGNLPRVSYMVPGCGENVFPSGPCLFFFSPTFFDIFPFDMLWNHVSTPILPLFWYGFYHSMRSLYPIYMKIWHKILQTICYHVPKTWKVSPHTRSPFLKKKNFLF